VIINHLASKGGDMIEEIVNFFETSRPLFLILKGVFRNSELYKTEVFLEKYTYLIKYFLTEV